MDNIYTTKQVAEFLKVTVNTVKLWLKSGKLKGTKVGKSWRITKDNLKEAFPENAFGAFSVFFEEEHNEKLLTKVSDKGELFKELYPKEYERDIEYDRQNEEMHKYVNELNNARGRYGEEIERRFPYPHEPEEIVGYWSSGTPVYGNEPEAYEGYYSDKYKEECKKFEKLMELIAKKYGVKNEDIEEIKRTADNIKILAQARYDE